MDLLILHRQRIEVAIFDSVHHSRAFQFAIRIDSIRYANRFESIRFVKKNRPFDSLVVMQFSCLFIVFNLLEIV